MTPMAAHGASNALRQLRRDRTPYVEPRKSSSSENHEEFRRQAQDDPLRALACLHEPLGDEIRNFRGKCLLKLGH